MITGWTAVLTIGAILYVFIEAMMIKYGAFEGDEFVEFFGKNFLILCMTAAVSVLNAMFADLIFYKDSTEVMVNTLTASQLLFLPGVLVGVLIFKIIVFETVVKGRK